jgi:hypothetical protein
MGCGSTKGILPDPTNGAAACRFACTGAATPRRTPLWRRGSPVVRRTGEPGAWQAVAITQSTCRLVPRRLRSDHDPAPPTAGGEPIRACRFFG